MGAGAAEGGRIYSPLEGPARLMRSVRDARRATPPYADGRADAAPASAADHLRPQGGAVAGPGGAPGACAARAPGANAGRTTGRRRRDTRLPRASWPPDSRTACWRTG